MPETHHVSADEIGTLRIYMTPKDRFKQPGQGLFKAAFSSRELYRELVKQAKRQVSSTPSRTISITGSALAARCRAVKSKA